AAADRRRPRTPRVPCRDEVVVRVTARESSQMPRSHAYLLTKGQIVRLCDQRLDDLVQEFIDLLRRSSNEAPWLERLPHHVHRYTELSIGGKPLEHIVPRRAILECSRRGNARLSNALVRLLSIAAMSHSVDDQLLRRHEGQLVG